MGSSCSPFDDAGDGAMCVRLGASVAPEVAGGGGVATHAGCRILVLRGGAWHTERAEGRERRGGRGVTKAVGARITELLILSRGAWRCGGEGRGTVAEYRRGA